jgi:hypothetical protein
MKSTSNQEKISVIQDNNKNSKNISKLDTQEEFRKADA